MKALYPDLIYCSISAYGQTGPWSGKLGVDGVLQAATGPMSITGAEAQPPSKLQAPVVDMVTGSRRRSRFWRHSGNGKTAVLTGSST